MLIEDAKVKELVYSGNTVIFSLPNRECMRENSFFWLPSQLITFFSDELLSVPEYCQSSTRLKVYPQPLSFLVEHVCPAIQIKPIIHFNHCIHINTPLINTKLIQIFNYCIILYSPNCSD